MATTKRKPRDLGTATGVKKTREKAAAKRAAKRDEGRVDLREVMDETTEADALEVKLGEAAKSIKRCHLLVQEAAQRLGAARKATSPAEAIEHDMTRIVDLAKEIGAEAKDALNGLAR